MRKLKKFNDLINDSMKIRIEILFEMNQFDESDESILVYTRKLFTLLQIDVYEK